MNNLESMTEQNEKRKSGVQRYYISSHRTSSVRVVTFEGIARKERTVRIVNMSVVGVGIESTEPVEPGLVCFGDQVGGHKLGILTWCRKSGSGYRAGISFVKLPYEKEQYILTQVRQSRSQQQVRDPEKIISVVLKTMKAETSN